MELRLKRTAKKEQYTIGKLSIDGKYYCDTLEDRDRGLMSSMPLSQIARIKVNGETAIPIGKYRITVETWLSHPQYQVPLLHNVPGFSGILIHNGSNASHTQGCILVGTNSVVGGLTDSKRYMLDLTSRIKQSIASGEKVTIEIF